MQPFYVGSIEELYLLAYGVKMYDSIFDALSFLFSYPFAEVVLVTMWMAVKRSGFLNPKTWDAIGTEFVVTLPMMMLVAFFCVFPSQDFDGSVLKYGQICTPANGVNQNQTANFGKTDTTADDTLAKMNYQRSVGTPQIPLLWDFVLRLGYGVNRGVLSGAACFNNVSTLDKNLRQMKVADSDVQSELAQFTQDCYLPAKARLDAAKNNQGDNPTLVNTQWAAYQSRPIDPTDQVFNAKQDVSYVGSRFFLETPGFYNSPGGSGPGAVANGAGYRAGSESNKPAPGWHYDPVRDCGDYHTGAAPDCTSNDPNVNPSKANDWGYPTCSEWWVGTPANKGLRDKVKDAALFMGYAMTQKDLQNELTTYATQSGTPKNGNWMADKIVATVLSNDAETAAYTAEQIQIAKGVAVGAAGVAGAVAFGRSNLGSGMIARASSKLGGFADAVGSKLGYSVLKAPMLADAANQMVDFYATMFLVKQAYPYVQASILGLMIMLLPFFLLMSRYSVKAMMTATFAMLGIIFWSALFVILDYMESNLFSAMFPDITTFGTDFVENSEKAMLIGLLGCALFVLGPLVLSIVMGWAGWTMGREADSGAKAGIGGLVGGLSAPKPKLQKVKSNSSRPANSGTP